MFTQQALLIFTVWCYVLAGAISKPSVASSQRTQFSERSPKSAAFKSIPFSLLISLSHYDDRSGMIGSRV
jgi:hypothetical protein